MFKRFPLLFIVIFVLLLGWVIFIHFIAERGAVSLLFYYQVDKTVHVLGGFMAVGVLIHSLSVQGKWSILALVAAAILWEAIEVIIMPDVRELYRNNFYLWRADSILDFISGMIGGSAAFLAYRPPKASA